MTSVSQAHVTMIEIAQAPSLASIKSVSQRSVRRTQIARSALSVERVGASFHNGVWGTLSAPRVSAVSEGAVLPKGAAQIATVSMMSSVNQGAVLRSPVLRILTVVLKFSVLQASVFPISPVALLMTVQGGSRVLIVVVEWAQPVSATKSVRQGLSVLSVNV